MDTAEARAAFRDFAGQDGYRRFVRTLNRESRRKGRLFFWQEELWREFVAKVPGASASGDRIQEVFRTCDVHGGDLETCAGSEPSPEIRHTPEYDHALYTLFPFAGGGDLVCRQCQAHCQRWISENDDLCRILRCQTTYEAFCERELEGLIDRTVRDRIRSEARDGIRKRAAEIAAEMQPGDELWEWDGGGWHQLAGRKGVAIVREGRILKKWCEVRS